MFTPKAALTAPKPAAIPATVGVVQRRERAQDREQRVRCRPAVLAAVLAGLERAHLERHVGHPAQRRRQRRHPRADRAHVADDQRAGSEALRIGRGIAGERAAADPLIALDADLDADRGPARPGAQRSHVGDDVRLRVGGPAAEERAVALGRLERRRVPQRLVARRDDVVVAVQQHGVITATWLVA